jgi:FAD/FMN-containing dehydrogenase
VSESWTNWSGALTCSPHALTHPHDEAEIAAIVHVSRREGRPVRPLGSGHSSSELCATDGVMVALDRLSGIESTPDPHAPIVTVRAGTVLRDLGRDLHARGLALANLGDIDTQTLAGALATGTHGTGRTLGNLSSQVAGVRFVDAEGEIREARIDDDVETLRAARVSLGVLGILTSVTLRVRPAYRLHERVWREPLDTTLARLEERLAATRHFEFFYYPKHDFAECKAIDASDAPPESVVGRAGERVGWSHEILPSPREDRFHEMEYSVPAELGETCFRELAARLRARHPEVGWPLEFRTVAPDDALLSMAHGRETVSISVHQDGRFAHDAVFADLEPIAVEAGGRPHWGKWHRLRAAQLARVHPGWQRFRAVRKRLDPEGAFLSPYLRALLGE